MIAASLYLVAISITVRLNPSLAPRSERLTAAQRLQVAAQSWPVAVVFGVVLGGLFLGLFSPTEAASIGGIGVGAIALLRGRLTLSALTEAARETASLSGMIFLILIGAALFNFFVETTQLTRVLVDVVNDANLAHWQIIVAIILLYLVLGCFMDSVSMIFLTMPFVFPVVQASGFDPIWFGILLLSVVEIGLITPPVGMNLFIVKLSVPDVSIRAIYAAIVPFLMADVVRLTLVASVPALSLFLVSQLFG